MKEMSHRGNAGFMGGGYGLGFLGAAIYFVQQANSFGAGLWGIIKAIVWPAFLVYHLFLFLHV